MYGTASADIADTAHVSLEAPRGFNLDNRTLSMPLCENPKGAGVQQKEKEGCVGYVHI